MTASTSPSELNPARLSASYTAERWHKAELVAKRLAIVLLYAVLLVICLALGLLYFIFVWPVQRLRQRLSKEDEPLTNDWWGLHSGDDVNARNARKPPEVDMRKGVELHSCYITTRDGIKLAADVWIPKKAQEAKGTLPVIYHQARYYRSATLRWPFNHIVNGGKPISFINDPFFKSFLSHGMILVSVDVRGTGASFGIHPGPWSEEEQQDSLEVLDWIDEQPWSNGRVGLWGVSYEGTSAFFTSLLKHPSVVCCCPMFFFWDVYDDISHPGGVPMRHFARQWQGFNDSLDSGWVQSTGWMARIFLEGVSPVGTEDPWGYQVTQALEEHKANWSLLEDDHIRYMDDTSKHTARSVRTACASQALHELLESHGFAECPPDGPHSEALRFSKKTRGQGSGINGGSSTVPGERDERDGCGGSQVNKKRLSETLPFYLHVSGWLDASANAAIMAFTTVPCRGSELLIGPWSHGGHQHVRPHHITSRSRFDFGTEVSGFFVRRLSSSPSSPPPHKPGGSLRLGADDPAKRPADLSGYPDGVKDDHEDEHEDDDHDDRSLLLPTKSSGAGPHKRGPLVTRHCDSTVPLSSPDAQEEGEGLSAGERVSTTPVAESSVPESRAPLSASNEDESAGGTSAVLARPSPIVTRGTGSCDRLLVEGVGHDGSGEPGAPEMVVEPSLPASTKATTGLRANADADADGQHDARTGVAVAASADTSRRTKVGIAAGAWKRHRPRVRFFTHQEERWHEATTFPSSCSDKADVVLSLGKRRPPPRRPSSGGGSLVDRLGNQFNRARSSHMALFRSNSSSGNAAATEGATPDKGGGGGGGGASEARGERTSVRSVDDLLCGVKGWVGRQGGKEDGSPESGLEDRKEQQKEPEQKRERRGRSGGYARVDGNVGGSEGPWEPPEVEALRMGGEPEQGRAWEGDDASKSRMEVKFEDEVEHDSDVDVGAGVGGDHEDDDGASGKLTAEEGEDDSFGEMPSEQRRGEREVGQEHGTKASGLGRWTPFRKSKLSLSQDVQEEEEVHELVVDVLNDRDGEGVSRWIAMTEFVSLISYQMDGLRSNHLRFTSPPLKQDMEVTGFPVVTLWVSADDDIPNLDVFAYLQAVRPRTGLSIYVTEGCFRAEHRKEDGRRDPVDVRALPGVPIHSYLRKDAQGMRRRRPVQVSFKLMPTSFRFLKGQRVRLSIGGADARHFHPITQALDPLLDEATPPTPGERGSINADGEKASVSLSKTLDDDQRRSGMMGEVAAVESNVEGGASHGAGVTRRVLRVHTGGQFASSVSLPVPRSGSDPGELEKGGGGEGSLVDAVRSWAADVRGGRAYGILGADRRGARNNVATPRAEQSARNLWNRRTRSLSSPDMSTTAAAAAGHTGPLRQGRWAADVGGVPSRGRSEVRSSDRGLKGRVGRTWDAGAQDESRIFDD